MKASLLIASSIGTVFLALGLPAAQTAESVRAFAGARVFDGTDRAPIENATILVRGGRIVDVGPASAISVPPGAARTSLVGKTVVPGFVNAHGHVGNTVGLEQGHYSAQNVERDLRTYAAYGVTTVFSLGDDQAAGIAARDAQSAATLDRARLFVAGPVLEPKTPAEARTLVANDQAMKVDIVKIRVDDNLGTTPKMAPDVYRAVIDEAHRRGLRVAVHVFYLDDTKALLEAGADFIAHSIRDKDVDDEVVAMLKRRRVCVCPTLTREVSTFVYESTPAWFSDPLFLRHADAGTIEKLKDPARQRQVQASASAQRYKVALEQASRNLKKLSDAGVAIAMGTDTGPPARFQGYFELMELELMNKAGLTPRQVLLAATRDAASCQHLSDVGTLAKGNWADFVALDANPLADISNVRRIDSVWIAGNRIAK